MPRPPAASRRVQRQGIGRPASARQACRRGVARALLVATTIGRPPVAGAVRRRAGAAGRHQAVCPTGDTAGAKPAAGIRPALGAKAAS